MWDGLDCQILIFTRGSFLVVRIIKVVLEYGWWTFRYGSIWMHSKFRMVVSLYSTDICFITFCPSQRIEPYTVGNRTLLNSNPELKLNSSGILPKLAENSSKISLGRLSISQDSDPISKDPKSLGRLSASQNSDHVTKESKSFPCMFCFHSVVSSLSELCWTQLKLTNPWLKG